MRKVLVSMLLLVLFAVAAVSATTAGTAAVLPAGASGEARGASACFGVGTNNCCGEFMVLGVIAGLTGNVLALAVDTAAMYHYCY